MKALLDTGQPPAVRAAIGVLDLTVAGLLVRRGPAATRVQIRDVMLALPSLLLGGLALRWVTSFPGWAQTLFAAGAIVAVVAVVALGRSFSVLPAVRPLVRGGPYRVVRHPAYAGELLMVAAAALAAGGPALLLGPLAAVTIIVRIGAEERVLTADPSHRDYRDAVRWRLVPGVW